MFRTFSVMLRLATAPAFAACGASTVPRFFPVPEGAENPISLEFRGATPADIVPLVAQICADAAVPTVQIDRRRGHVETRWVDLAQYASLRENDLPAEERQVMLTFDVDEGDAGARAVKISAIYQPLRPLGTSPRRDSRYDRLVPTGHPAYQLALELEYRLRQAMAEAGIVVVS